VNRWAFVLARALVAAFCVLTWAYGVIVSVRFAFEQFIRPQLFPWVSQFVTWHHAWYWGAFVVSAATIVPDLLALRTHRGRHAAGWLAVGYLLFFGAIGVYLLGNPYLVTLDGGDRRAAIVPGALLPLLWLAAIDHLGRPFPHAHGQVTGQRRLFSASLATAAAIWLLHLGGALLRSDVSGGWAGRAATTIWALALDITAALAVFVTLVLAASLAAARRRSFAWEYAFVVTIIAAAITEFVRRFVLPSLAFAPADAALAAVPFGVVMALMWSGWRLRHRRHDAADTAAPFLLAVFDGRSTRSLLLACAVPLAAAAGFRAVEQVDWALIVNRLIAVIEAALLFGFFLARFRDRQDEGGAIRPLVAAPLAALLVLWVLPPAARATAAATRNANVDSELALERLPVSDPAAAVVARLWVEQQTPNMDYFYAMTASNARQSAQRPAVPAESFARVPIELRGPQPHIFILMIDSLRRDYLSPYNPAVTFTPGIAAFAAESYVFRNAFTAYGGTWLSIPSMWTGTPLTRGWGQVFRQINAIEPLITGAGYDLVINDYTMQTELQPSTQRTFLNPGITSVYTDLCDNVKSLQQHIDTRPAPGRPLFTFLAPMNVHIMNTRILNTAGDAPDPRYAGFYSPYASRLERLDGCFSAFVAGLKERGIYDDSIIIVTSDHGESLGVDGNWGHQFFLFPEDVRIPLIVRLPAAMRERFTTDLGRVTLLPDLAPTLLALAGQAVPELPPPAGAALFVPPDRMPRPQRRESFLIMSSYGSTFALLRRNGKFLYISDLVNWREYAYSLFDEPLGQRVPISDSLRRVGQAGIVAETDEVDALFRAK
jgi:hypothetical protein